MRVAIDCRYIRERPSGIGTYTQELIQRIPALAPRDHFHLLVDPRAPRPLVQFKNTYESVVIFQANSLATLACPAFLADLRNTDVYHATFNTLGRGLRSRSVVTLHDLIWLFSPLSSEWLTWLSPIQALYYRDGILRALRKAARIICISRATADTILSIWPEAKPRIRIIHHGVSNRFQPPADMEAVKAKAARLLKIDAPYFLVLGQNAPFKNHAAIEQAYAQSGLHPRVRLVMVQRLYSRQGNSAVGEWFKPSSSVMRFSAMSDADVLCLMQGALALVQFSRFEGFGMPVLEAMASGTPVIASDIPALEELLEGAGMGVPLNPLDLARAMVRLSTDPSLCRELSARGLERARAFSWDRSAALHWEVYREAYAEG